MKLIHHWRMQLNKLWSVRIAIFSAILGVADQLLAAFQSSLPAWVYALLFVTIIVARIVDQPKLHGLDSTP